MMFKKRIPAISIVDLEADAISASHLVARLTADGEFIYANNHFLDLTGYSSENLIGRNYQKVIRPQDHNKPSFRQLWQKLRNGEQESQIAPHLNANGDEVWLDITYSPILNADGEVQHILVLAHDITDFHLKRRDNRSQVDAVKRSLAVIEFDLKGNILDANQLFLDTVGYTLNEIKGKHHRIFMPKGDEKLPEYNQLWTRLASGSSEQGQVKRISKSGRVCWLEATYETLIDPEGRPFKVVKYAFDITQAKNLEADASAQLSAIQRVQAVIEFDSHGKIMDVNEIFCKAVGYEKSEIIGKNHRIFVSEDYANSREYTDFWTKLRSGTEIEDKFVRYGKNGKKLYLRASYNPIRDASGEVVKVVKFAMDTTVFQVTVDTMRAALEKLAQGNLNVRLTENLGELDEVRLRFNDAVEKMDQVISSVVTKSGEISNEAEAITNATHELSQRTEQQAATLEESAAALELITNSVKSAAELTKQVRDHAHEAKNETDHSSAVVQDANTAMDEIAASSKTISSITNVIDDIAFQTNLLALNAGVEAARAGDAGRGFAVVASEVRALAQRSSEAAREIATLISSSGVQVQRGVELVGQAGTALGKIDTIVTEIRDSILQIANSAEDQSNGLIEMNNAVGNLDRATQKNAAMAEETNAAIQTLNEEIASMRSEVRFFEGNRAAEERTYSRDHVREAG